MAARHVDGLAVAAVSDDRVAAHRALANIDAVAAIRE
jgi:hypothetical protein